MKSYTLFSEFLEKTIYGNNPAHALLSVEELRRPGVYKDNTYTPGQVRAVSAVVGQVDTEGMTRGGKPFIRMVSLDTDGHFFDVDMAEGPAVMTVCPQEVDTDGQKDPRD